MRKNSKLGLYTRSKMIENLINLALAEDDALCSYLVKQFVEENARIAVRVGANENYFNYVASDSLDLRVRLQHAMLYFYNTKDYAYIQEQHARDCVKETA
jgi:hypothetical protein